MLLGCVYQVMLIFMNGEGSVVDNVAQETFLGDVLIGCSYPPQGDMKLVLVGLTIYRETLEFKIFKLEYKGQQLLASLPVHQVIILFGTISINHIFILPHATSLPACLQSRLFSAQSEC